MLTWRPAELSEPHVDSSLNMTSAVNTDLSAVFFIRHPPFVVALRGPSSHSAAANHKVTQQLRASGVSARGHAARPCAHTP